MIISKKYLWIFIVLLVFSIDRLTKFLVLNYLAIEEPWPVLPILNFFLTFNSGAAFSFLHQASGWQEWLFIAIAVGVSFFLIIWQFKIEASQLWLKMALALIQGGTLGNLYDRIAYRQVIDFIDFYFEKWHYPTFNLADSAICTGAIMLIIYSVSKDKKSSRHSF